MMTSMTFLAGLALLIAGAELLVRGASRLAETLGISPLIVGLTVVAFGTSAPELAVSVKGALAGRPDLAVGNVVGSNIFNVLLILGLSAMITPLVVAQRLVRVDVPLMIGASFLVPLLGMDGGLVHGDGLLLFAGILAYTAFAIRTGKNEPKEVELEYARAARASRGNLHHLRNLLAVGVGLVMLVLGADWLVDGAIDIARALGLSELVIALTIVAAGTSLPEVATSVVAAVRGERDIAVGNVVGSNIFNILAVLGATALVSDSGLSVSAPALRFDVPVMVAAAVACLPVFLTGHVITRGEGALFLGYYATYLALLLRRGTDPDPSPAITLVAMSFVTFITVVTVVVGLRRSHSNRPAIGS